MLGRRLGELSDRAAASVLGFADIGTSPSEWRNRPVFKPTRPAREVVNFIDSYLWRQRFYSLRPSLQLWHLQWPSARRPSILGPHLRS
jgi:hypothetical protein